MKSLVIVESPTKARTISKFLGKDFVIKASMGHVMDLPKSTLGVDVEKDFQPAYETSEDKKKIISELKTEAKLADQIILATDPDREGEAIASHVAEILSEKDTKISSKKKKKDDLVSQYPDISISSRFKRIVFHEITKEAVEEALKNPREINEHLVNAQTARRVLDRLVGYKLSPILWQKVRRGLSAGRVQSVALRLIVEREKEIEKFRKEPYWTVSAFLEKEGKETKERKETEGKTLCELIEINGEKIEFSVTFDLYDGLYKVGKTTIDTEEKGKAILSDLNGKKFIVSDVVKKETKRSPSPPFTTSTLQQDAARRFGFTGKKTMSVAQKLYEEGYITYHRTDSVILSTSAVDAIRAFVEKTYSKKYLPEKFRFFSGKQKLAQEAHEAIRPTKLTTSADAVTQDLGRDFGKLYELIWQRAVASQMSDALIESTAVLVETNDKKYLFKANGSVLVFDGFLKVNPQALQDNRLPEFTAGEELTASDIQSVFHETPPPPRYNYASLISTLEEKGIGRPSTYAPVISTIEERQYVNREPPTGAGKFVPTTVGVAVNDFLVSNFSDIDDVPFTAEMEDKLDAIASGEKEWVPMMEEFYRPFEKKLGMMKDVARVKIEVEQIDEKCPECGNNLVIRLGRFGKFISCSTFPTCKFSKPFVETAGMPCPKDGGDVVIKRTRKGRIFYGCSNYPKCDFAAWKLKDINTSAKAKTSSSSETSEDQQSSQEQVES